MTKEIKIGIIGGSGFYDLAGQENREERAIQTPFGSPSDPIVVGNIAGVDVAFVARHGKGHRLTPTEVPYAANIFALKTLGVEYIIAVSACGSLREDYAPGHICIPDQVVDLTRGPRIRSFFGDGLVAHVGVADPFSPELSEILAESAEAAGAITHRGGTFVTVEGPRFSTRAESETFRTLGYSIIGMTSSPEAYLAREAEIAYAVFAHVTDYDVWKPDEEAVTAASVAETFHSNLDKAKRAVIEAVPRIAAISEPWPAHQALKDSLITSREVVPPETIEKLRPIVGKYFA